MDKDVLGKKELEFLKLNWNFAGPGLMSGHCTATGTCENQPTTVRKSQQVGFHQVQIAVDEQTAEEIKNQFGNLRF